MRVVFDTNVLVSALVFPDGRADAAVRRIIEGKDDLVLSTDILGEVISVLARKFGRDKEELSRVAVILSEMAEVVEPMTRLNVFRDDPDNRILECAVAGKASKIVTGDKAMLALGEYAGIRLISLSAYLSPR
jgi:putative PIN family toxin of toxin-antitoxin system